MTTKTKESDWQYDVLKNAPLVVIDGNNVALRMFFAHKTLTAKVDNQVINSGMIFGFTKFIVDFIETYTPEKCIVTWDSKSEFRYSIYPEYKAGRNKDFYDDVSHQFPDMAKLLTSLGIEQWKAPGYEADDLILTALDHFNAPLPNIVVSTDKDLLQLIVDDTTYVFRPGKNDLVNVDSVTSHFGLTHLSSITDFLVLCGDSADNIKGVPGIGEKTAQAILNNCVKISIACKEESIPGVSQKRLDFLKSKEGQEHVALARKLIHLIKVPMDKIKIKQGDPCKFRADSVLKKYEIATIDLSNYFSTI